MKPGRAETRDRAGRHGSRGPGARDSRRGAGRASTGGRLWQGRAQPAEPAFCLQPGQLQWREPPKAFPGLGTSRHTLTLALLSRAGAALPAPLMLSALQGSGISPSPVAPRSASRHRPFSGGGEGGRGPQRDGGRGSAKAGETLLKHCHLGSWGCSQASCPTWPRSMCRPALSAWYWRHTAASTSWRLDAISSRSRFSSLSVRRELVPWRPRTHRTCSVSLLGLGQGRRAGAAGSSRCLFCPGPEPRLGQAWLANP